MSQSVPPLPAVPAPPAPDEGGVVIPALEPSELRRRYRAAAWVAAATGSLLVVAWMLPPASDGFGTHRALGLPPCSWPARFGLPCPSCGMTTAFALASKGRIVESFATQPMGCVLALAAGMTLVGSIWTLATGRTLWPVYGRMWNARLAWILGIAALLAWAYKSALMCGWVG
ncbi:MAG: DUF2752 domain-containing protein [Planctomycetaceae bacterium]|nr:DUF2752 domain-containing protein [Planctomycetaceae bacterium]